MSLSINLNRKKIVNSDYTLIHYDHIPGDFFLNVPIDWVYLGEFPGIEQPNEFVSLFWHSKKRVHVVLDRDETYPKETTTYQGKSIEVIAVPGTLLALYASHPNDYQRLRDTSAIGDNFKGEGVRFFVTIDGPDLVYEAFQTEGQAKEPDKSLFKLVKPKDLLRFEKKIK